jgi:hypothetical protein
MTSCDDMYCCIPIPFFYSTTLNQRRIQSAQRIYILHRFKFVNLILHSPSKQIIIPIYGKRMGASFMDVNILMILFLFDAGNGVPGQSGQHGTLSFCMQINSHSFMQFSWKL